ncbi:murein hydrolase activator NlpD [Utexia brackfieldae]|uniref:murein hydrolase activator NlpD n=1 Tax=Utexia brackfieldae TaxID=3074108 RepID=UPI00370D77A2
MSILFNTLIQHRWAKTVTLASMSLFFVACTQTNPAQIRDISAASPQVSPQAVSTDVDYDYEQPPSSIQTRSVTPVTQTVAPNSTTITTRDNNDGSKTVVTTSQQRMVYSRNYDDIPKGGYKGSAYTVKRGDTLFYIAWITGNDYRALAARNNIKEPYDLHVGQVLDVNGDATVVVTQKTTTTTPAKTTSTATANTTGQSAAVTKPTVVTTTTTTAGNKTTTTNNTTPVTVATVANLQWQWPTRGKVIEAFSNESKGIDIAGSLGDKIVAAAAGRVVYAGSALPGYGNLIIIKHNDDYLTAYAHNQNILVKEGQDVAAGQQIATMGNTGGVASVRLHFEIRYKAKSVDPMKYLPKQ